MPLPTNVPVAGEPDDEGVGSEMTSASEPSSVTTPPKPFIPPRQGKSGLPTAAPAPQPEPTVVEPQPVRPASDRYLDDEIADAVVAAGGTPMNRGTYVSAGKGSLSERRAITADDAINNNYDTLYGPLEPLVKSTKEWLQGILTDRDMTQEVAIARASQGSAKYIEVRAKLEDFLFRHFNERNITATVNVPIIIDLVVNEILGLGPIEPLWQDKRITEIMVNGPHKVRVEIGGRIRTATGVKFRDQEHLLEVCQQILAPLNRTLDTTHPYEDGRLRDGSRVNLTHPVIGPGGPYVTIRRFPEEAFSLRKLLAAGSMNDEMAQLLGMLVHAGASTLISGGTGTGKTSALNALSGCIPMEERIITIEDTLELRLHPERDVVAMEAVKSRGDASDVTIRDLVRNSLRQRPDRIVVGEVRDASAYDMLQAMNTGHEGSMTTIHSNNPFAAIDRLAGLINMAGGDNSDASSLSLIANSLDIIVQLFRYEDGSRRVASIAEVPSRIRTEGSRVILEPRILWEFKQTGLNEDGVVLGEHVKVEDLSPEFISRHRLEHKEQFSLEQLLRMSDLPEAPATKK